MAELANKLDGMMVEMFAFLFKLVSNYADAFTSTQNQSVPSFGLK
jgi:hypothetical protein